MVKPEAVDFAADEMGGENTRFGIIITFSQESGIAYRRVVK